VGGWMEKYKEETAGGGWGWEERGEGRGQEGGILAQLH
jgi:hypothetical protein